MTAIEVDHAAGAGPGRRNRSPNLTGHTAAERAPNLIAAISEATAIRETRDRAHAEIAVPDRMSGLLTGGSFVLALTVWLILVPPATVPLALLGACGGTSATAASTATWP